MRKQSFIPTVLLGTVFAFSASLAEATQVNVTWPDQITARSNKYSINTQVYNNSSALKSVMVAIKGSNGNPSSTGNKAYCIPASEVQGYTLTSSQNYTYFYWIGPELIFGGNQSCGS